MFERIKTKIKREFFARKNILFTSLKEIPKEEKRIQEIVLALLKAACSEENIKISDSEEKKITEELVDEILGFGPIKSLLIDPSVTEIMINGFDNVYIERNGKKEISDIKFTDERQINQIIERILMFCPRHVDQVTPFVDASLPDGSRVNIIIPPLAANGAVMTIRKFSWEMNSVNDLIRANSLNENMAKFLVACIKARLNILFSGATGSGKTTTLNILSREIDENERIITIEDTLELRLQQKHVVQLLTRQPNIEGKGAITLRQIFINSLRMRPDRIILGEIRADEAIDMLQAISSGHVGSLAVIHGQSAKDVVSRIETMIVLSSIALPVYEVRKQIASSLNIIVQQERFIDGVRRITQIAEVRGLKDNEVELVNLFSFEQNSIDDKGRVVGDWICSGIKPSFYSVFKKKGIELSEDIFKKE